MKANIFGILTFTLLVVMSLQPLIADQANSNKFNPLDLEINDGISNNFFENFDKNILKIDPTRKENSTELIKELDKILHPERNISAYYISSYNSNIPLNGSKFMSFKDPTNLSYKVSNTKFLNIVTTKDNNITWDKFSKSTIGAVGQDNISIKNNEQNFTRFSQEASGKLFWSNFSLSNWTDVKILTPQTANLYLNLTVKLHEKVIANEFLDYFFYIDLKFYPNKTKVTNPVVRTIRIFLDYKSYYTSDYQLVNIFPEMQIEFAIDSINNVHIYNLQKTNSSWKNIAINITKVFERLDFIFQNIRIEDYYSSFIGFDVGILTRKSIDERKFSYDISTISLYNDIKSTNLIQLKSISKSNNNTVSTQNLKFSTQYEIENCNEINIISTLLQTDILDPDLIQGSIEIHISTVLNTNIHSKLTNATNEIIYWTGNTLTKNDLDPVTNLNLVHSKFWILWLNPTYWNLVNNPTTLNQHNLKNLDNFDKFFNFTNLLNLESIDQEKYNISLGEFVPEFIDQKFLWKHQNALSDILLTTNYVNLKPEIILHYLNENMLSRGIEVFIISNKSSSYKISLILDKNTKFKTIEIPETLNINTSYYIIIRLINTDFISFKDFNLEFNSRKIILDNYLLCQDPVLPNIIIGGNEISINFSCIYDNSYFTSDFWNTVFFKLKIDNKLISNSPLITTALSNYLTSSDLGYWPYFDNASKNTTIIQMELEYFSVNGIISIWNLNTSVDLFINNEEIIQQQDIPGAFPVYFSTIAILILFFYIRKRKKLSLLDDGEDN